MLVRFETKAYASITMFGEVAVPLIKMMGHTGIVPGALLATDVPTALARLESAVAAHPDATLDPDGQSSRWGDTQDRVSLARRALPLLELMRAAAAQGEYVLWEY